MSNESPLDRLDKHIDQLDGVFRRSAAERGALVAGITEAQRAAIICLEQTGNKWENDQQLVLEKVEQKLAALLVLVGVMPHVGVDMPE